MINITVTNPRQNLTLLVLPLVLIFGFIAHELIIPSSSILMEHTVNPLWSFFVYGHIWLNAMVGLGVAWWMKGQFDFLKVHPGIFDAVKITMAMFFIGAFENGLPVPLG